VSLLGTITKINFICSIFFMFSKAIFLTALVYFELAGDKNIDMVYSLLEFNFQLLSVKILLV
jgi:uncharacterized metal-binding protein